MGVTIPLLWLFSWQLEGLISSKCHILLRKEGLSQVTRLFSRLSRSQFDMRCILVLRDSLLAGTPLEAVVLPVF